MIAEVMSLYKSFGKNKVLEDVNFSLEEGKIYALVGRNGSGKTTLLKIMADIFQKDLGKINIYGKSFKEDKHIIENIAYLPDRFDYFDYSSVEKMLGYYQDIYPKFDKRFVIKELEKNNIDIKKNLRSFSKGYKNLIGLLAVIGTNAKLVLLDEILDGMDVLNKELILSYILDMKDFGRTVLASSHELEELAKIADETLYISKNGRLTNLYQNKEKFVKLQVVVKDKLDPKILERAVLRFNLGRVYTILIENKENLLENIKKNETVVQFDILDPKIEDYFYWEKGRSK
ncbi:ATP-binding cassette domain-containing protein [Anaerococcus hydrogenalis]|uniref:ABC transporter n=1 Tax=Anaerococcus hydrogenalis TaxID=33029 RepID=A0A2N6UIP5_9FIRM|nr:ATP-binding cassette domain-containing protein [Anaerococcus hydrogenalis]MDK7694850.1 ATP-binding cassette domain-containing protein [Anaerococcus hydrogenalis]MDK7696596.1 ATP-binding cassette domain-containing protein [Anaerococcus hydrogenalis]MDK7707877.1 ATP-binding cassette domain-containing protein [Anaerococcus hydrogenalis]PMC81486.1 ABC transporter [Anaerococcus hydrogenalis]